MSSGPELDHEQAEAATAPADARLIVLAGPGAGKTEVVASRCRSLTATGECYPEDILLISFSNAAVDVVRTRTADIVDDGAGVDVSTIDSLARRVRLELGEDNDDLPGYDRAIVEATKLLDEATEPVFDYLHVVVDEVQDVVGARARFVLALLRNGVPEGAGFTLLGDPLQGLYDFQAAGKDDMTSSRFLDEARGLGAREVMLKGQYRARSDDARRVADQRAALSEVQPVVQRLRLQDQLADLSPLGPLEEDTAETVGQWSGSTVFLCDTNARAALVADRLAGLGLKPALAARATEPIIGPWLAAALGRYPRAEVGYEEFVSALDQQGVANASELWHTAVRETEAREKIDLARLGVVLGSRPPRSFLGRDTGPLTVSTVHRAKGLEFDNVVLVDPEDWGGRWSDADVARVLFVALSRAAHRLTTVAGVDVDWWTKDKQADAWVKTGYRRKGIVALNVEPRHLRSLPLDTCVEGFLGRSVNWSDPVDDLTVEGELIPRWTAALDGVEVAKTTDALGLFLKSRCFKDIYPRFSGGRIESFQTVCGGAGDRRAPHGMWLGARVAGPVRTEWQR